MVCTQFCQKSGTMMYSLKIFAEVDVKGSGCRGRDLGGLHSFVDMRRSQSGICTYDIDFVHMSS